MLRVEPTVKFEEYFTKGMFLGWLGGGEGERISGKKIETRARVVSAD